MNEGGKFVAVSFSNEWQQLTRTRVWHAQIYFTRLSDIVNLFYTRHFVT